MERNTYPFPLAVNSSHHSHYHRFLLGADPSVVAPFPKPYCVGALAVQLGRLAGDLNLPRWRKLFHASFPWVEGFDPCHYDVGNVPAHRPLAAGIRQAREALRRLRLCPGRGPVRLGPGAGRGRPARPRALHRAGRPLLRPGRGGRGYPRPRALGHAHDGAHDRGPVCRAEQPVAHALPPRARPRAQFHLLRRGAGQARVHRLLRARASGAKGQGRLGGAAGAGPLGARIPGEPGLGRRARPARRGGVGKACGLDAGPAHRRDAHPGAHRDRGGSRPPSASAPSSPPSLSRRWPSSSSR